MLRFDDAYRSAGSYFGGQPDELLVDHLGLLDRERPVLDIGCGQGRHALWLAHRGFAVDALDPSQVAIDQVMHEARAHNLSVRTIHGTFEDVDPPDTGYGAVLVFGLIPVLTREEISRLVESVTAFLRPGGLLFTTAFGTWDPAFDRHASEWRTIGSNSFRSPAGDLRTYLQPGELAKLFPEYHEVDTWEGLGPEHRHGSGPVERHGLTQAVLRR